MTEPLQELGVQCPYCGKGFATQIDITAGDQNYIEDCQVCCKPIMFNVHIDADGKISEAEIHREDD
jgi:hypothetical protein